MRDSFVCDGIRNMEKKKFPTMKRTKPRSIYEEASNEREKIELTLEDRKRLTIEDRGRCSRSRSDLKIDVDVHDQHRNRQHLRG